MVDEDGAWKQRIDKETRRLYFSNHFDNWMQQRSRQQTPNRTHRLVFTDN